MSFSPKIKMVIGCLTFILPFWIIISYAISTTFEYSFIESFINCVFYTSLIILLIFICFSGLNLILKGLMEINKKPTHEN